MQDSVFHRSIFEHRRIVAHLKPTAMPAHDVDCKEFNFFTIYRSFKLKETFPTLLYIPGNAFVASETDYTHFICSHIAQQSRCQVIVIKHRLAPEFKFPIGLNDAYCIIKLLLLNSKSFNIEKSQVAIAGYSSGGNIAALIAINANKHLSIARQILISPITDLSRSLKNFKEFEEQDTAISEHFVEWFLNLYVSDKINLKDPKISPYWEKDLNIQGLPVTDLIVGEFDRFRGDAELYKKKLSEQGNIVNHFMFKQENHSLLWYNKGVINNIAARLSVAFGTDPIERSLSISKKKRKKLHI